MRQGAEGFTMNFMITRSGNEAPLIGDLAGRWSGTPEPYRTDLRREEDGGWTTVEIFDHSLVPGSFRYDIPSTGVAEEVAITVWRDGEDLRLQQLVLRLPAVEETGVEARGR
jgi:hypothetical protein